MDYSADKNAKPEMCNVRRTLKADWVGGTQAQVYPESGKEMPVGGKGDFKRREKSNSRRFP